MNWKRKLLYSLAPGKKYSTFPVYVLNKYYFRRHAVNAEANTLPLLSGNSYRELCPCPANGYADTAYVPSFSPIQGTFHSGY